MESRFETLWPDLFAGLDRAVRQSVVATLADMSLAGVEPTREDAADLVALAIGEISEAEYDRRTAERVLDSRDGNTDGGA
jgi:Antitoxin VbhA